VGPAPGGGGTEVAEGTGGVARHVHPEAQGSSGVIAEWFADGTVGPLFGREFDLGEFAWRVGARPSCHLWLTANISGPEFLGFGGWRGVNVTGWSHEAFDTACNTALNTLPDAEGYVENQQEAVRIFMTELPAIPLFAHAKTAAASPLILNFHLDPSQPSELWNIAELDLEVTN
jgi:ABC-type transport system substrate-binding protein